MRPSDGRLLVGPETCDDAGVYLLTPEIALVETCDIITPPVNSAYDFGRIAAANALSDVYAMGARPLTAMNLVFFPNCLPPEMLGEMLAGSQSALDEAGVCLVGGHTVEDDECKFGLSVTGTVAPDRIIRNSTARRGDMLILTQPLGSGIVSTAIKGDMISPELEAEAIRWMSHLNRNASELMLPYGPSACTDITGFGLLGHVCEMARGAGATFQLDLSAIPLLPGLLDLAADGLIPAGCYRNRDHYQRFVSLPDTDEIKLLPLFDPQTSGGLLIALAPDQAARFTEEARQHNIPATVIGRVAPPEADILVRLFETMDDLHD